MCIVARKHTHTQHHTSHTHTHTKNHAQNGSLLRMRGLMRQRLGSFAEAQQDFSAALPLLREAGEPLADTLFNRGYCHKWVRTAVARTCSYMRWVWGRTAVACVRPADEHIP